MASLFQEHPAAAILHVVLNLCVLADVIEQPLKNKEGEAGRDHQQDVAFGQVELPVLFQSHQVALPVLHLGYHQVDLLQPSELTY